ncbi:hypothetical protein R6Q59_009654 [Mikania micrantha]
MGQIVKRKRRGRPSNIDRARRSSHDAPPSPLDRRSSRRRRNVRYNFDVDDYVDEDEEVGRRQKKIRLLMFEDESISDRRVSHAPSSSSSSSTEEDDDEDYNRKRSKKWKQDREDEDYEIEEIRSRKLEEEEEVNEEDEGEEEDEEACGSDFDCVSDLPKRVPVPDKKTLELILDKLQKKDIYGVYAEPVDPEELPDYHDVIKHPMDFATVRKKLAKGLYSCLKEFESDVFLICTNAMQYNAPDTIYYKQASSIQEQAKLKFQRLRTSTYLSEKGLKSDLKTTPGFSLPKKQLRKSMAGAAPVPDPVGTESYSGATVRTGEFQNASSAQTPNRPYSGEIMTTENSSLGDDNLDKDQEPLSGKGFMSKHGRKPSVHDENRRATYNMSVEPKTDSDSVLSIFEGESKQFIPVGLHVDHSYARSLARFAATLGPVAWRIASHTIEQALPEGVKYGPGWVGEYEPLPTPLIVPKNYTLKEPNFLAPFKITSDVKNNEKASQAPKILVDVKEANDGFNPGIPVKQESPREPRKDAIRNPSLSPSPSPSPSPRTSLFSGSNLVHQNLSRNFTRPENMGLQRVELNHPPPLHVSSAADFVAKKPISNTSDVLSKHVSRNGSLASMGSFKHPDNKNDIYAPGRLSKPVGLDCNRMIHMDSNMTPRRDLQGLNDPVQMMKMLSEKSQQQQNNSNCFGFGSKRVDSNVALTAAQAWMSLGSAATGGVIKPPLLENRNPQQQILADSLYNPTRDHPQSQVTRFRGEYNTYQQPVRPVNDGQLQNINVGFPQMITSTDLSRFQVQSGWRGVLPQMQQQSRPKQESHPPDLNIGYHSIGSPVRQSTGMLVDSQQPDLALQL